MVLLLRLLFLLLVSYNLYFIYFLFPNFNVHHHHRRSKECIEMVRKYESEREHRKLEVATCERMVVERVRRATVLHLQTKEKLTKAIVDLESLLNREREERSRERGSLEGRIMLLETTLSKCQAEMESLKNVLVVERRRSEIRLSATEDVERVSRLEYEKRESGHFEDMRLCQRLLETLQAKYDNDADRTLQELAREAQKAVVDSSSSGGGGGGGGGGEWSSYQAPGGGHTILPPPAPGGSDERVTTTSLEVDALRHQVCFIVVIQTFLFCCLVFNLAVGFVSSFSFSLFLCVCVCISLFLFFIFFQLRMTTIHWERKVDLMKRREEGLLKKMVEMEERKTPSVSLLAAPASPKSPPRVKATRRRRKGGDETNDMTPPSIASTSSAWSLDESEIQESEMSSRRFKSDIENEEIISLPAKKGKRRRRKKKTNRRAHGVYQRNGVKIQERHGKGKGEVEGERQRKEHSNVSLETGSVRSLSKRLQTTAEMSREIRQKGGFERSVALDM